MCMSGYPTNSHTTVYILLIKALLSVKAAVRDMAESVHVNPLAIAANVSTIIVNCIKIVGIIEDWIATVEENDEMRGKIARRAEVMKGILEQLQAQTIPDCPTVGTALKDLETSLENCKREMDTMKSEKKKLFRAGAWNRKLQGLCEELTAAAGILNLALGACSLQHQLEQQRRLEKALQELVKAQQEAVNPQAGVYCYTSKKDAVSPYAEVVASSETDEYFLAIGWRPSKSRDRTSYEVQYDEEHQRSVFVGPKETGVKLGKPKVDPGRLYRIRIREITSSEPKKWSSTITVRMDYDSSKSSDDNDP